MMKLCVSFELECLTRLLFHGEVSQFFSPINHYGAASLKYIFTCPLSPYVRYKIQAWSSQDDDVELALINLDSHQHFMASSYGLSRNFLLMRSHETYITHIENTKHIDHVSTHKSQSTIRSNLWSSSLSTLYLFFTIHLVFFIIPPLQIDDRYQYPMYISPFMAYNTCTQARCGRFLLIKQSENISL
jgi:hypothetical protein